MRNIKILVNNERKNKDNLKKIWEKIQWAFIKIEVQDKKVSTIVIPKKVLREIIKEPTIMYRDNINFSLGFVENPTSRNKNIWGAKVKIGKRIKAIAETSKG